MLFIRRQNFSRRALLWLLVVLAAPLAAPAATLEESARELARKIAGNLPAQEKVLLEIRNTSSLSPTQVDQVEKALEEELQNYVVLAATEGEASARVAVTLSENIKDLVWAAEVRQDDASRTVMLAVQRSGDSGVSSAAAPITLRADRFWEGPERILDAAAVPDSTGGTWLVLLVPEGLRIKKMGSDLVSSAEIQSAQTSTRDPKGSMGHVGDAVIVRLEPQVCTVVLATLAITDCHSASAPASARDPFDIPLLLPIPLGKGSLAALVRSDCAGGQQFLVTGAGDDTQQDSVQLYESQNADTRPISDPLYFLGPVLALHSVSLAGTDTVVVRNLKSGNYEAYRLSITCGQ